ncbi:hypothetical protein [Pinibacter soli]|uniref:SH3 domain-containing protein n=1 Tax=Pinibacter soli TaxID=3044211 RepID=A0ABT6RFT2_9BACT|nr:hypothetical protein [Pinibacter soli]MDI3321428.1 hypothetical protein [Pinibacter soli]
MKRLLLTPLMVMFICKIANAQWIAPFAIIKDHDGFTNVRAKETGSSKVIDSLTANQVFEDLNLTPINEGSTSDWHLITYARTSKAITALSNTTSDKEGYIHKSRIQYLSKLPQLRKKMLSQDCVEFKNDTLKLLVVYEKFIPDNHKITKKDGFVVSIDNVEPMGMDGIIPESLTALKSVTIIYKDKSYNFPSETLNNLFSPNAENMYVALSDENVMFLVMSNGDAAGAYNVVWTIKNNQVISRFVNRDF